MEKVLRHAFFECITEITFVVAPLRNNLGGVTDRQTCADWACYQMVFKYVKVKINEHMKWRKCFHGHCTTHHTEWIIHALRKMRLIHLQCYRSSIIKWSTEERRRRWVIVDNRLGRVSRKQVMITEIKWNWPQDRVQWQFNISDVEPSSSVIRTAVDQMWHCFSEINRRTFAYIGCREYRRGTFLWRSVRNAARSADNVPASSTRHTCDNKVVRPDLAPPHCFADVFWKILSIADVLKQP